MGRLAGKYVPIQFCSRGPCSSAAGGLVVFQTWSASSMNGGDVVFDERELTLPGVERPSSTWCLARQVQQDDLLL